MFVCAQVRSSWKPLRFFLSFLAFSATTVLRPAGLGTAWDKRAPTAAEPLLPFFFFFLHFFFLAAPAFLPFFFLHLFFAFLATGLGASATETLSSE